MYELQEMGLEDIRNIFRDIHDKSENHKEFSHKQEGNTSHKESNDYFVQRSSDRSHEIEFKLEKCMGRGYSKEHILLTACENGHIELVELLLSTFPSLDPSINGNNLIRISSEMGHLDVVRFLLMDPRVDPSDLDNEAIVLSSANGHHDVVSLLMKDPRVDPYVNDNEPMYISNVKGHHRVLNVLMDVPDFSTKCTI